MANAQRMPVLFVGHGSPMNALEDNPWSRGFAALATLTPRPRAILAISAHWYIDGTHLTGNEPPPTIHDFGGFPDALSAIQYPAPGDRAFASHIAGLLEPTGASLREDWGLDHGTWSVLRWMYPEADIPVVQLSMNQRLDPLGHLAIGAALHPLREERVLILASGNLVHNLRDAFGRRHSGLLDTPEWARDLDTALATALEQRETEALVTAPYSALGRTGHPTPEHYLPLLYAYGASDPDDDVSFPIAGFDWGSLSMRAVAFLPQASVV